MPKLIDKVTAGFVTQTFDTEKKKCISQAFIAGGDVSWEDSMTGKNVPDGNIIELPYQTFNMVQPPRDKNCQVRIIVSGGVIQDVQIGSFVRNVVSVVTVDYDVDDKDVVEHPERFSKDEQGDPCIVQEW